MRSRSIQEVIEQKVKGFYFGNRLILPFTANFLKIILDDEMITDFSSESRQVEILEEEYFTSIYFLEEEDIAEVVSSFEAIKIIAVEKHDDMFDSATHKKISITLEEPHFVVVNYISENMLFIE